MPGFRPDPARPPILPGVKVLYVEDDPVAREFVEKGLSARGFVVDLAGDLASATERAFGTEYDLLILDVNLPDGDGFGLLRELRSANVMTPALFLSARSEVTDRIRGLDIGADDYLSKPFAFEELVSRIRAIARRRNDDPPDGILRLADLEMDTARRRVSRAGQRIELTPKQFSLLEYLLRNAGFPLSREMIIEKVWGYGFESKSNAIDVQVNYLRKRIDRQFEPKLIHTVKGVGYVLEVRGGETDGGR